MKRIISRGRFGLRCIIAATVCICASSLSAQTYYRIHKDEFAAIAPYLNITDHYFTFAIASPENGVVMSSSNTSFPNASFATASVTVSNDSEVINVESQDGINFGFSFNSANSDSSEFSIGINQSDVVLGVVKDGTTNRFAFGSTLKPFYTDFDVVFDLNNDGNLQLRTGMKDDNDKFLSIELETNRFRLRPNDYNSLSIYRLDYFDWTIDDSDVNNSGNIILSSTAASPVNTLVDTAVHYILNDGEDVSIEDLINSENKIPVRFKKGEVTAITVPTKDIASRSTLDTPTTLWALPVSEEFGNIIPLGKVITKKYADDGISTGVMIATEDTNDETPVYYTLDGRVAATPLMPGIYVRRTGDKSDKVIIR